MPFSKTAGTLVAEMLMIRAAGWNGPFLMIEGPDDDQFWRPRVKLAPEAIVISQGVRNLQGCMSALPAQLAGHVCAIADRDFREHLPADPFAGCSDVFFYDEGFLETFALNSIALAKVLAIHANSSKIAAFLASTRTKTVYGHLRRVASVFGRLRILNANASAGACFDRRFTPYRYVNSTTWILEKAQLISDFSQESGIPEHSIQAVCGQSGGMGHIGLMHGHDTLKILSIGLRCAIGSVSRGPEALCRDLTLAFEASSLQHKVLTKQLRAWAGDRQVLAG